jgi:hypothetical protein
MYQTALYLSPPDLFRLKRTALVTQGLFWGKGEGTVPKSRQKRRMICANPDAASSRDKGSFSQLKPKAISAGMPMIAVFIPIVVMPPC